MKKKVIDIFPPKEKRKTFEAVLPEKEEFFVGEQVISNKEKGESFFSRFIGKIKKIGELFKLPKTKILFPSLLVGVLLFVFLVFHFAFSQAKIEIWPEGEKVSFETKLTLDTNKAESDFSDKVIPGQLLVAEKTISETFSASGRLKKEEKAEGMIRVYNNYSTSAQALLAITRFVSTEGKLFRTPIRVIIPGAWYDKGKLVAGEVDIKVVADQAGPEYNIGASTFSIPGFAGTDKYTKFYAQSFQPMSGGFSQEVSQVTAADLRKAETVLISKARDEAEAALKEELRTRGEAEYLDFDRLENIIQTEFAEGVSSAASGALAESFNFQVRAESKVLVFKKADLESFAEGFIMSQIANGPERRVDRESMEVDFSPEIMDIEEGKMSLSLEVSAKVYANIDISSLKNELQGKSSLEARFLLGNQPEAVQAKVEFWPFWVKSAPKDENKIKIKLNLDHIK